MAERVCSLLVMLAFRTYVLVAFFLYFSRCFILRFLVNTKLLKFMFIILRLCCVVCMVFLLQWCVCLPAYSVVVIVHSMAIVCVWYCYLLCVCMVLFILSIVCVV